MQTNARKAKRFKEIDHRHDDPSDTFNSMVSEDPISDDDLGLADVSYMSIFNDFDETVTYDKYMFRGRIIDDFSMITIGSTTADNHECTLCTGTNDLEGDTGTHTNL